MQWGYILSEAENVDTGVISQGAKPLFLNLLIILGDSAPLKILTLPCFSEFIGRASKVFSIAMIMYALLRGY